MNSVTLNLNDDSQLDTVKALLKALKIKFTVNNEKKYDPKFVSKIKKSEEQIKTGNYINVKKDDINNLLGL